LSKYKHLQRLNFRNSKDNKKYDLEIWRYYDRQQTCTQEIWFGIWRFEDIITSPKSVQIFNNKNLLKSQPQPKLARRINHYIICEALTWEFSCCSIFWTNESGGWNCLCTSVINGWEDKLGAWSGRKGIEVNCECTCWGGNCCCTTVAPGCQLGIWALTCWCGSLEWCGAICILLPPVLGSQKFGSGLQQVIKQKHIQHAACVLQFVSKSEVEDEEAKQTKLLVLGNWDHNLHSQVSSCP